MIPARLRISHPRVHRNRASHQSRYREEQIIKTIRLSDSDLEALRQVLGQLVVHSDSFDPDVPPIACNSESQVNSAQMLKLARNILVARRRRARMFSKSMFGEPAWDMLLTLYAGLAEGPRHSIGRLTRLSGAPPTTALRWLDYLEKKRLVVREPNPTDRRSDFVSLTEDGRSMMDQYLSETLQSAA